MATKLRAASIPVVLSGVFLAATAHAQDRCELFVNNDLTGATSTVTLPTVTATLATGSPLNSTWANTSKRVIASELGSLNNTISSARIRAVDSDVALYLLDGNDFNGHGNAVHCRKGRTCWYTLGSDLDDKTSSVMCQREFFRKAMFKDPNVDPAVAYLTAMANPIIDLTQVSAAVDTATQNAFQNQSGVDAYRPTNSEDGWELWSRTTWITSYDFCKRFNLSCQTNSTERYRDMFRISKRFEIDVNNFWADVTPFLDDDYVIQADWYIRPVITDQDNNASTPNELRFWWGHTEVWVEGGALSSDIMDQAAPAIFSVNIQDSLRLLAVALGAQAGCPTCVDGKQRLQLGIYSQANVQKNVWWDLFDMDVTHAKLILNANRDAVYND